MAITQAGRILKIYTPLGEDFLLMNSLSAVEELSGLFKYEVELLHEETKSGHMPTDVDIQSILGKGVTITISQSDGVERVMTGIVNSFSKRNRDTRFSYYRATIVPHVWLLTQKSQSRIFQQKSVKEILEEVFDGFEVKFEIQEQYERRNYCVQYNETDFDFASRLMEEEGFYYYFEHTSDNHKMIIADTAQSHADNPGKSDVTYQVEIEESDEFISNVSDLQIDFKLQSGKVAFRDSNFQLPGKTLEVNQPSFFKVGDSQNLEIYDYPGGYARKYDGKSPGGEDSNGMDGLYPDRDRTAKNAILALDSQFEVLNGLSNCCAFTAGYRFKLKNHPNKKLNRQYILTSVSHHAQQSPDYVSENDVPNPYTNNFTCIPHGKGAPAFKPKRKTPKPVIQGSQTAVVVGPSGEEILTDSYGRVKVQFPWDRQGQVDESSSCWVRVAQSWAGNGWGTMFIPRIGMEVVVDFLGGDPDQPIISGCVYNPDNMPPYPLPDEKTKSTIKSDSSKGGGGFNEFRFEDKKGEEQIFIHAQKDIDIRIKNDRRELVANDRHTYIQRDKRERIKRDEHKIVERDCIEQIERDEHLTVMGKSATAIQGDTSIEHASNLDRVVRMNYSEKAGFYSLSAGTVVIEGDMGITLKVGGNFITISPAGIMIQGTIVMINSGGAPLSGAAASVVPPLEPEEAHIADNADPGSKSPTYKNQKNELPTWKKPTYSKPTHKPNHPSNKDKKSWIKIKLVDEENKAVAGERYRITLPDGKTIAEGTTDANGKAHVTNIDPGNCKIAFPARDGRSWSKK